MNTKIKYDMKISKNFTGIITYDVDEYDSKYENIQYDFTFDQGKLIGVRLYYDEYIEEKQDYKSNNKWLNTKKFNQDFWIKAPLYCNTLTRSFKRSYFFSSIVFHKCSTCIV